MKHTCEKCGKDVRLNIEYRTDIENNSLRSIKVFEGTCICGQGYFKKAPPNIEII